MSKKTDRVDDRDVHDMVVIPHEEQITLITERIDLRDIRERRIARLRALWYQRNFLLRITFLGLILSTAIAYLIPSRFTSTARLMPPDSSSGSGLENLATAFSGNGGLGTMLSLLGSKDTSDAFVGILGSRTAKDHIIQEFDLEKLYHVRTLEDARKDLENHTNVSVDRKSQIVTIEVWDKKPERAASIVRAYIQQLDQLVATLSTSSARRERIFLEERLKGVNRDLESAETNFSQFASKNTAINVPEQGRALVAAAAEVQGQLIAAQSELEGLRQIYNDNNVRIRSVTSRVKELQEQLHKVIGTDNSIANGNPGTDYPSIRQLPLLGVTYADLYRQIKIQEAVLEALTKEYELAKVQEAKEIPTVKVLDAPDVPQKKSFPPRLLFVILGTALVCLLGVLMIWSSLGWSEIDDHDPRKAFARELLASGIGGVAHGSTPANIANRVQRGLGWRNGDGTSSSVSDLHVDR